MATAPPNHHSPGNNRHSTQIKYVDCGGSTGLLPYVILRWAQKRLSKGWRWGLENEPDAAVQGLYYTEADNVLFMPRPDSTKRAIRKVCSARQTESTPEPPNTNKTPYVHRSTIWVFPTHGRPTSPPMPCTSLLPPPPPASLFHSTHIPHMN